MRELVSTSPVSSPKALCKTELTCDKHRELWLDGTVVPVQGADDGRGDEVRQDDQVAPFQPLVAFLTKDRQ